MDFLKLLSFIFLLSSCTKFGYVIDQGKGQISLLHKAKDNKLILNDPKVSSSDKQKIRKIQQYKEYFYKYFEMRPTSIYSKTTFLNRDAVTYLVIASPFNEISAIDHCFPLVGCFPYLGFFEKNKATEFEKGLSLKDYYTYQRPVYAYSTTGYFTDPILSSFFKYRDFDLAEMIFHELFHTILFIKDEVDFNENLANYFGTELAFEYFKSSEKEKKELRDYENKNNLLKQEIVESTKRLAQLYKTKSPKNKIESELILNQFLNDDFLPHMKNKCDELKLKSCFPLKRQWNNASFSAYLTYEKDARRIEQLHSKLQISLKDFFYLIKKSYKDYEGESFSKDFLDKGLKN